ncbi:MAG: polysaccharide deacetylase family protein [Clostridiales bacterium]|nr:polysaccharide deacetylase family protein [Clostridiales bacterium]
MAKRIAYFIFIFFVVFSIKSPAQANNTKLIALTFDDGPHKTITPQLLDELAERNVKVTFFLVGRSIEYYPEIAERAANEGHQLANHSYSHPWFTKISPASITDELGRTNELIAEVSGKTDNMVRIPYGDMSKTVMELAGAPIIQWSVDPANGYMSASEELMKKNLVATAADGAIAILHDTGEKNLNVALYAIDELLAAGYEFVTLDELFRLRGVQPEKGIVYYSVPSGPSETYYDESKLSEHWAAGDIDYVLKKRIILGDGEGFSPNAYMSRAMAATVLWRVAGSPEQAQPVQTGLTRFFMSRGSYSFSSLSSRSLCHSFADVPEGQWYSQAVGWAYKNGYIKGISENSFAPNEYITREQFYTILGRYAAENQSRVSQTLKSCSYRDDVRISPWACEYVSLFRDCGFVSKNDKEIFRPLDYISRAEAAELITWFMQDIPSAA